MSRPSPRTLAGAAGLVILLAAGWGLLPEIASRVAPLLTYVPSGLSEAQADPAAWGLRRAEQLWIRGDDDGPRLHAWWVPARGRSAAGDSASGGSPPSRGTVLYFHGNAGHLAGRAEIARRWSDLGLDVLLVDYRGYGRSEGSPSERGLYRDGEAAWRHLVEERGVSPERLLVHGHSLGAAVATHVAAERRVAGVVASAGFTTLPSLASRLYGWIPGRAFRGWERNRFDSEARLSRVDAPVLVVAGGRDDIVEAAEVRRLFEAAREPKRWVEVPGARHNDLLDRASFWREAASFADEALPGESESVR